MDKYVSLCKKHVGSGLNGLFSVTYQGKPKRHGRFLVLSVQRADGYELVPTLSEQLPGVSSPTVYTETRHAETCTQLSSGAGPGVSGSEEWSKLLELELARRVHTGTGWTCPHWNWPDVSTLELGRRVRTGTGQTCPHWNWPDVASLELPRSVRNGTGQTCPHWNWPDVSALELGGRVHAGTAE